MNEGAESERATAGSGSSRRGRCGLCYTRFAPYLPSARGLFLWYVPTMVAFPRAGYCSGSYVKWAALSRSLMDVQLFHLDNTPYVLYC